MVNGVVVEAHIGNSADSWRPQLPESKATKVLEAKAEEQREAIRLNTAMNIAAVKAEEQREAIRLNKAMHIAEEAAQRDADRNKAVMMAGTPEAVAKGQQPAPMEQDGKPPKADVRQRDCQSPDMFADTSHTTSAAISPKEDPGETAKSVSAVASAVAAMAAAQAGRVVREVTGVVAVAVATTKVRVKNEKNNSQSPSSQPLSKQVGFVNIDGPESTVKFMYTRPEGLPKLPASVLKADGASGWEAVQLLPTGQDPLWKRPEVVRARQYIACAEMAGDTHNLVLVLTLMEGLLAVKTDPMLMARTVTTVLATYDDQVNAPRTTSGDSRRSGRRTTSELSATANCVTGVRVKTEAHKAVPPAHNGGTFTSAEAAATEAKKKQAREDKKARILQEAKDNGKKSKGKRVYRQSTKSKTVAEQDYDVYKAASLETLFPDPDASVVPVQELMKVAVHNLRVRKARLWIEEEDEARTQMLKMFPEGIPQAAAAAAESPVKESEDLIAVLAERVKATKTPEGRVKGLEMLSCEGYAKAKLAVATAMQALWATAELSDVEDSLKGLENTPSEWVAVGVHLWRVFHSEATAKLEHVTEQQRLEEARTKFDEALMLTMSNVTEVGKMIVNGSVRVEMAREDRQRNSFSIFHSSLMYDTAVELSKKHAVMDTRDGRFQTVLRTKVLDFLVAMGLKYPQYPVKFGRKLPKDKQKLALHGSPESDVPRAVLSHFISMAYVRGREPLSGQVAPDEIVVDCIGADEMSYICKCWDHDKDEAVQMASVGMRTSKAAAEYQLKRITAIRESYLQAKEYYQGQGNHGMIKCLDERYERLESIELFALLQEKCTKLSECTIQPALTKQGFHRMVAQRMVDARKPTFADFC